MADIESKTGEERARFVASNENTGVNANESSAHVPKDHTDQVSITRRESAWGPEIKTWTTADGEKTRELTKDGKSISAEGARAAVTDIYDDESLSDAEKYAEIEKVNRQEELSRSRDEEGIKTGKERKKEHSKNLASRDYDKDLFNRYSMEYTKGADAFIEKNPDDPFAQHLKEMKDESSSIGDYVVRRIASAMARQIYADYKGWTRDEELYEDEADEVIDFENRIINDVVNEDAIKNNATDETGGVFRDALDLARDKAIDALESEKETPISTFEKIADSILMPNNPRPEKLSLADSVAFSRQVADANKRYDEVKRKILEAREKLNDDRKDELDKQMENRRIDDTTLVDKSLVDEYNKATGELKILADEAKERSDTLKKWGTARSNAMKDIRKRNVDPYNDYRKFVDLMQSSTENTVRNRDQLDPAAKRTRTANYLHRIYPDEFEDYWDSDLQMHLYIPKEGSIVRTMLGDYDPYTKEQTGERKGWNLGAAPGYNKGWTLSSEWMADAQDDPTEVASMLTGVMGHPEMGKGLHEDYAELKKARDKVRKLKVSYRLGYAPIKGMEDDENYQSAIKKIDTFNEEWNKVMADVKDKWENASDEGEKANLAKTIENIRIILENGPQDLDTRERDALRNASRMDDEHKEKIESAIAELRGVEDKIARKTRTIADAIVRSGVLADLYPSLDAKKLSDVLGFTDDPGRASAREFMRTDIVRNILMKEALKSRFPQLFRAPEKRINSKVDINQLVFREDLTDKEKALIKAAKALDPEQIFKYGSDVPDSQEYQEAIKGLRSGKRYKLNRESERQYAAQPEYVDKREYKDAKKIEERVGDRTKYDFDKAYGDVSSALKTAFGADMVAKLGGYNRSVDLATYVALLGPNIDNSKLKKALKLATGDEWSAFFDNKIKDKGAIRTFVSAFGDYILGGGEPIPKEFKEKLRGAGIKFRRSEGITLDQLRQLNSAIDERVAEINDEDERKAVVEEDDAEEIEEDPLDSIKASGRDPEEHIREVGDRFGIKNLIPGGKLRNEDLVGVVADLFSDVGMTNIDIYGLFIQTFVDTQTRSRKMAENSIADAKKRLDESKAELATEKKQKPAPTPAESYRATDKVKKQIDKAKEYYGES